MSMLPRAILLIAAISLSACSNAGRFDNDNVTDLNGRNGAVVPGSPNDPASPAFFQQSIGDRVLFEVDQSTLTPEGRSVLDGQSSWLMTNSDYNAIIEGHADEQGTREYNLALGARRANAVREYLVSKGVAGARLKTVSYGKERPIEICSQEGCYAKNRRAVTVIAADGLTS
ncbi:peptidoglycan-associated lipoprotein Pal [Pseudooceanicola sp.]|uniref:peptidoglycan-associated lipoprotein Pal n=1 Tax=Pseudooceanicola sp. TaxID=1914328 RepID=UPI002631B06F|nr:peptidoglycan-associated lipoprotein Pal [Pseudooceanicola sp.]MDF1856537.1 peptidoglycan-associated lipoprotein Pal [Pseudooceanicola sp.]